MKSSWALPRPAGVVMQVICQRYGTHRSLLRKVNICIVYENRRVLIPE